MLRQLLADLHVHTVLSPCAGYQMVPELIVARARECGLNMLAITDHNSGENAIAVMSAATESGVAILPGMEVESREGVHILTIFDTAASLAQWQAQVYASLPDRENDERAFGAQLIVDAEGNLVSVNRRLLITSVDLKIDDIVEMVRECGGISIPSHVDRPSNGLLGVLGLIPEGLEVPAMEISPRLTPERAVEMYPALAGRTLVRSSDAHALGEIGCASTPFLVSEPSVVEIARACRGELGRAIVW